MIELMAVMRSNYARFFLSLFLVLFFLFLFVTIKTQVRSLGYVVLKKNRELNELKHRYQIKRANHISYLHKMHQKYLGQSNITGEIVYVIDDEFIKL